jgi:hypothetical protein
VDIFVQEKQETRTRGKVLESPGSCPKTIHADDVRLERAKVSTTKRSIFLYICDAEVAAGETFDMEDTVVIPRSLQERAFGQCVFTLKAHCVSPSIIDANR